ncbi:MAG: hypothetical protein AB7P17_09755 [Nitrospirales bacterium]|nr:hypothetical protein [Nitrospirales bacterium]
MEGISALPRISILTATTIEFRAIGRALPSPRRVWNRGRSCLISTQLSNAVLLMRTGMGPQKSHAATRQLLEDGKWDLVISTGFAGALQDLSIGTLVLGEDVLDDPFATPQTAPMVCDAEWVAKLGALGRRSIPFSVGRFATVPQVLTRSEEKQKLAAATGAVAVDMESGSIGRVANEFGIPFVIIRTISDGMGENLPLDFNLFRTPSGWAKGLWQCLSSPPIWKGLYRLYRQSREAALQLTAFFKGFFAGILTSPTPTAMVGSTF